MIQGAVEGAGFISLRLVDEAVNNGMGCASSTLTFALWVGPGLRALHEAPLSAGGQGR